MTGFRRHDLPADITVFSGDFASQPLVYAHLLDVCPALDLGHVEVIQGSGVETRLAVFFDAGTVVQVVAAAGVADTLILIKPAAFEGHECPLVADQRLMPIGEFRGTVPQMVAEGSSP